MIFYENIDPILEKFEIGLQEARILIMGARLKMGWITDEDYKQELSDDDTTD